MTTVRRITVNRVDGDDANNNIREEIRPRGEIAIYENLDNNNGTLELLMFDGVRTNLKSKVLSKGVFYGGNADSSDGQRRDTIKLIPDTVLYRGSEDDGPDSGVFTNHQYLIVDPTAPNHIHLRAGGTIDNSNADLFLGGELNHVKVSDSYNNVSISTAVEGGGAQSWTFNNDGILTTPGNINLKNRIKIEASDVQELYDNYQGTLSVLEELFITTNYTGPGYPASKNSYAALVEAREANPSSVPSSLIPASSTVKNAYYSWAAATANLTANAGGLHIENGDGVGWRFEESTGLRFPDNTYQTTAWTGIAPIARKVRAPNEALIEVTSTGNPNKVWEFNANGSMTFPDGTEQTTAYTGTVYTTVSTSLSGIPEGFSVSTANPSNLTPGNYPNILIGFDGKNLTLDVNIDQFYNISTLNIRDVSPATFVVGDSAVLNGNIFGGTTPADNVTITVSNLVPTAIDLTKSINKLIDGDYTLADGVEGQIMYLVPQDGTALNNVSVSVANARVGGNTTGAELLPFRIYEHSGDGFYEGTGLCTLIFTDGAWQQSGGAWD